MPNSTIATERRPWHLLKPEYAKFSVTDSLQAHVRTVSGTQRQPADVPLRSPVTNTAPQRFKPSENHVAEVARTGNLRITQRSMIGLPRKKKLFTHANAGTHTRVTQLCNGRDSIFNATGLTKVFLRQSLRASRGSRLSCCRPVPAPGSEDRTRLAENSTRRRRPQRSLNAAAPARYSGDRPLRQTLACFGYLRIPPFPGLKSICIQIELSN